MAGHEHETEKIVAELLFESRIQIGYLPGPLQITPELFVLALQRLAPPDEVDGAVLRRPHEPWAWALRNALGGPLLESGDERILGQLLRRPYVADDASQPGDQPGRLDSPDGFDRAMRCDRCRLVATRVM